MPDHHQILTGVGVSQLGLENMSCEIEVVAFVGN
jgi:hypothetical protein